jgi:hypothetical protein
MGKTLSEIKQSVDEQLAELRVARDAILAEYAKALHEEAIAEVRQSLTDK